MGFAERLKSLREDRDEKQRDIARLLNVSPSMISFYESGIHFPRDERLLLKIAEHFDVSMDYLMGITDIPNYRRINRLTHDIDSLSPESLARLEDYIEYLKFSDSKG